jgi:hypothetical protein
MQSLLSSKLLAKVESHKGYPYLPKLPRSDLIEFELENDKIIFVIQII